jgi:hypothetical protein
MVMEICAGASALLFVVTHYLPGRWYWTIAILVIASSLLTIGVTVSFMSISKSKKEMGRGYTTIWKVAVQHPELTYLSAYDFSVISGPHEPRPRNGTRKVIGQFTAQRGT